MVNDQSLEDTELELTEKELILYIFNEFKKKYQQDGGTREDSEIMNRNEENRKENQAEKMQNEIFEKKNEIDEKIIDFLIKYFIDNRPKKSINNRFKKSINNNLNNLIELISKIFKTAIVYDVTGGANRIVSYIEKELKDNTANKGKYKKKTINNIITKSFNEYNKNNSDFINIDNEEYMRIKNEYDKLVRYYNQYKKNKSSSAPAVSPSSSSSAPAVSPSSSASAPAVSPSSSASAPTPAVPPSSPRPPVAPSSSASAPAMSPLSPRPPVAPSSSASAPTMPPLSSAPTPAVSPDSIKVDSASEQRKKELKEEEMKKRERIKNLKINKASAAVSTALTKNKQKASNSITDFGRTLRFGKKKTEELAAARQRKRDDATREKKEKEEKKIDEKVIKKLDREERVAAQKTRFGKFKERNRDNIESIKRLKQRTLVLYALFKKYLLQPIIMIIVTTILYYSIKYFIQLYKRYPRSFVLSKYLDLSGKFDKSTGVDMEIANILSESLTDYLVKPARILATIRMNSHYMIDGSATPIETAGTTNNKCRNTNTKTNRCNQDDELIEEITMNGNYSNYLTTHLFGNYVKNNSFYKILRKFVEHGAKIYDRGYRSNNKNEYVNNSNYKNEYFDKYYETIKDNATINSYLVDFFKNIIITDPIYDNTINHKIYNKDDENDVTFRFINELNKNTSDDFTIQINKSYSKIKQFFYEILTTSSSKLDSTSNILEYYRNLFFRNVLYVLILDNEETISNQLGNLENKNIVSYLDPNILSGGDNSILQKYGYNLFMIDDDENRIEMRDIFNEVSLPSNVYNKLNNITASENLIDFIDNFKTDFENNFNSIKNKILKERLINYKDVNDLGIEISGSSNSDYYVNQYNNYKTALLEIKDSKYDSENNFINKLYNFNLDNKKELKNFSNKFNINYVNEEKTYILEIFNHLIILEHFIENYDELIKTDNKETNYDNCVNYLYYVEKFLTLTYYNSDKNKKQSILDNIEKKKFINNDNDSVNNTYIDLLDYLLYKRDEDLINCGIFTCLMLYNPSNSTSTKNDIHSLSKFYFSFIEIKLANNYINDIKNFKEHRTNWNLKQHFIMDKIGYIWKKIIWENFIMKGFIRSLDANNSYVYWKMIRDILSNRCTYFTSSAEKDAMNCSNDNFKEGFGFLKKLLSIPKMLGNLPEFLMMFINFGKGFLKGWSLFLDFKPFFIGFVIFLMKVTLYLMIFMFLLILALPFFVGGLVLSFYSFKSGDFKIALFIVVLLIGILIFQQWLDVKFNKTVNIIFYTNERGQTATISIAHLITAVIYGIIQLILLIIKCIMMLVVIAGLFVLYIVVLILDEIFGNYRFTKFLYKRIFSCENDPLEWYKNSRYDLGNKASRGFFCSLNCRTNYRLSENKLFCEKAPSNVPYYCPQPLLYNIYKNEPISGSNKIISFFINDHPGLIYKSPQQQAEFIINYKKEKKDYYEKCNTYFTDSKNIIGKSVCATGFNKDNVDISSKIKDVCKQTYCSNGKYENFCYKYKDNSNVITNYKFKDNNKLMEYIKNTFAIITIILVIFIIIKELDKDNILKLKGKNIGNYMNRFRNMFRRQPRYY